MKRLFGLVLVVSLFHTVPAAAAETNIVNPQAAQLSGVVKLLYTNSCRDEQTRSEGRDAFALSLVDLRLSGRVGEHVDFRIEAASSWNPDHGDGSLGRFAGPDETGWAGIRQASIAIEGIIPWTRVELGTFIPPLTNYMARPVENLDLIQYPLINNAVYMDTGWNHARADLSPWQQTGVNFTIKAPYMVQVDLGLWNGMMPNHVTQPDPSLAKATSIALTFKPVTPLSLSFAMWGERFEQDIPGLSSGAKRNLNIFYFYGSYITDTIEVTADFAQGSVPGNIIMASGSKVDWRWEGMQVMVGYWFRPYFEALVRYETFDPNTLDTVKIPASRFDRVQWLTIGGNFRINEQAEVSLNYVFKWENAKMIDKGDRGKDPLLPDYDPKFSAQNNDLLLLQVQLWQ
jgi:hypothetical protein